MSLIITVIIIFLLVAFGYQIFHRMLVKRATLMLQKEAKQATDAMVIPILESLVGNQAPTNSQIIADVWGKGVLVFEYIIDLNQLTAQQKEGLTKEAVAKQLIDLTVEYQITDWWTYEQDLHIEVAQLSNEATKEYVKDIKKVDRH